MNDSITLVLPVYVPDEAVERRQDTFVSSLAHATELHSVEVVVVENGSDTMWKHVPKFKWCRTVCYNHPVGYARAANAGIALADTEFIVILNNDLVLPPGWLEQLVADYKEFGPGILSPMHYKGGAAGFHPDSCWFSCWMSDKKTLQKIGYFDEMLPYRLHDQDYAIRCKKAGFIVGRTGNVVVEHFESTTYKKMNVSEQEAEERRIMRERYGCEHFHEWLAANVGDVASR